MHSICMPMIRKHWPAILGFLLALKPAMEAIRWLVGLLGDIDFVATRISDPAWIGDVAAWLADPPGWVLWVLLVVGLGLIYWDTRRQRAVPESAMEVPENGEEPSSSGSKAIDKLENRGDYQAGDHDLIPLGLWLNVKTGRDGADITANLGLRNRSMDLLMTKPAGLRQFEIGTRVPIDRFLGGGLNLVMPAGSNQNVRFGPIRILEAVPGVKGRLAYEVRYGQQGRESANLLRLEYHFTIMSVPTDPDQQLDCAIEERVSYSDKAP